MSESQFASVRETIRSTPGHRTGHDPFSCGHCYLLLLSGGWPFADHREPPEISERLQYLGWSVVRIGGSGGPGRSVELASFEPRTRPLDATALVDYLARQHPELLARPLVARDPR